MERKIVFIFSSYEKINTFRQYMKVSFKKCNEAIKYCVDKKSFGLFYSENHDSDTNIHVHECCEVLLCLTGGKSFFINDRIYEVNSGDIFIINQFESHKIISEMDKTFRRFVFQVHPTFLYSNSTENTDLSKCFYFRNDNTSHKITLTDAEMEFITNNFLALAKEYEFGDDIIKNVTVITILTYINKYFKQNNKDFKYIPSNENKVIENSITYIVENLSSELTLEKIAKHSYISVNQLCRLFKKYLGTTVIKYITSKRITEAKKLLNKGNNVSEVALTCGFLDYSNFIRTFKNIVGISPGKYAKRGE